jgi:hypothetical protein
MTTMNRKKIITLYYTKHIFLLTYRKWLTFTGSVCITCAAAIHNQFLFPGPALYMPTLTLKNQSVIYSYQGESRQTLQWAIQGLSLHVHMSIFGNFY